MIDFEKLEKAYNENRFYSLQLEVGDVCYQGCSYCYMNALTVKKNSLTNRKIYEILTDAKKLDITAIEWLGGEPLLRRGIFSFLKKSKELGFRNNMWTGGLPLKEKNICKKLAELCEIGLISFHLSTLNKKLYEELHPGRPSGDIDDILTGIKYLLELGYPANQLLNSITFTGYQTVDDLIETMEYFDKEFGIKSSLNVYHTYLRPGTDSKELSKFIPSEKSVAKAYKYYTNFLDIKNFPMNCVNKQYCSATVAALNDGTVSPCATIRTGCKENLNTHRFYDIVMNNIEYLTFAKFKDKNNLPEGCKTCKLNDSCWGCRSRAYAAGLGIYGKDPRCFRSKK